MPSSDIIPYVMPGPAALPPDRTGWAIDPGRAALVVLNVQNHFLHVLRESSAPVGELLTGVGQLTESARAAGIPVLYTLKTAEREPDGHEAGFGHPRLPGGEDSVTSWTRSARRSATACWSRSGSVPSPGPDCGAGWPSRGATSR
ncbi:hypothetical protein ACWDG9_24010 [Streptomyces sp. NPDC001073]